MKSDKFFFCLCLTLLLVAFESAAHAQQRQSPPAGTDAAEAAATASSGATRTATAVTAPTVAASGPRTSPFNPPTGTDHSFFSDSGPKLDTGCIFRSQGPIFYSVEIERVAGELKADGTLKDAAALVAAGLLSPTAKLIMPAYDVDSSASFPGVAPERDQVFFNGEAVGFLAGVNNTWKLNTFEIPIAKVKFAQRGANGSSPTPGVNTVRIDIDTANANETWCTSIDWGSQSFKAMSPIILVHGNNSDGGFYERQGFTSFLRARHLLYDNSISMPTDSIAAHGNLLNNLIPGIVKSFGVDSVHVIVHSKGGLDTRDYLANYQPSHNRDFKVLSFTSLSTPHNGSVAADVAVTRANAAAQVGTLGKIEFEGFPAFTRQLVALAGTDAGTLNLTQNFVAGFNAANVPRLAGSGTTFSTTAADADTNGNARIDRTPDEYAELRAESSSLRNADFLFGSNSSRYIVDAVYQILRNTSGVNVRFSTRGFCPVCRRIATITSVPNAAPVGNDTLVTIPSGHGLGSILPLVSNRATFRGPVGRNHSSIADNGVAAAVFPWLLNTERSKGDLK